MRLIIHTAGLWMWTRCIQGILDRGDSVKSFIIYPGTFLKSSHASGADSVGYTSCVRIVWSSPEEEDNLRTNYNIMSMKPRMRVPSPRSL